MSAAASRHGNVDEMAALRTFVVFHAHRSAIQNARRKHFLRGRAPTSSGTRHFVVSAEALVQTTAKTIFDGVLIA